MDMFLLKMTLGFKIHGLITVVSTVSFASVLSQELLIDTVVDPDPDPAGSEIICNLGSESATNFGL
jgi:hypothetical protein